MRMIRLFAVVMLVTGALYLPEVPIQAECGIGEYIEIEGCPAQGPRDNGCACCSDNHCASGHCNKDDKCADPSL